MNIDIGDVASESTYKTPDPAERGTILQGPARHPKLRRGGRASGLGCLGMIYYYSLQPQMSIPFKNDVL